MGRAQSSYQTHHICQAPLSPIVFLPSKFGQMIQDLNWKRLYKQFRLGLKKLVSFGLLGPNEPGQPIPKVSKKMSTLPISRACFVWMLLPLPSRQLALSSLPLLPILMLLFSPLVDRRVASRAVYELQGMPLDQVLAIAIEATNNGL